MAAGPTDHVWELREPIALMPKPVTAVGLGNRAASAST
jgi:hypothetical protein